MPEAALLVMLKLLQVLSMVQGSAGGLCRLLRHGCWAMWLLIELCCAQGSFLDDLQRLHVPSLTWGKAPEVSGRPSRALRRIAGHTFAGLLAFGGCIPTIMGIMPVEKLDLLLLGANAGSSIARLHESLPLKRWQTCVWLSHSLCFPLEACTASGFSHLVKDRPGHAGPGQPS